MIQINQYLGKDGISRSMANIAELYYEMLCTPNDFIRGMIDRKEENLEEYRGWLNDNEVEFMNDTFNRETLEQIIKSNYLEMAMLQERYTLDFRRVLPTEAPAPFGGGQFSKIVQHCFRYKDLRNSSAKMQKITNWLNIKACPYCNSQYLLFSHGINDDERLFCLELDHILPKSIYPYLSISIYNLLPICGHCNQKKSDNDEDIIFNPYSGEKNFHDVAKFTVSRVDVLNYLINNVTDIELKIEKKEGVSPQEEEKLNTFLNKFQLVQLYNQNHQDVVKEIYLKSIWYDTNKKEELKKLFEGEAFKLVGLQMSNKDVNRFILGGYSMEDEILKRPLTKFIQDIAKSIGLDLLEE